MKNLKLAPGAEVEVKAGEHYQKKIYEGVPLVFGLGGHKQIDTVRISWPNGLIQNQPNEPARSAAVYQGGAAAFGFLPHDLHLERPRVPVHHRCARRGAAGRQLGRRQLLPGGPRRVRADSRRGARARATAATRSASPKNCTRFPTSTRCG